MISAETKIIKKDGSTPNDLERDVAKGLFDIEVSPASDIKNEVRDLQIVAVKEIDVEANRKALVVFVPFRCWAKVQKIQSRLIRELEKKFNKKHVVLIAQRTILGKDCSRKGISVRPRTRTLTSVHQKILEDIVGPTEIVGQRMRIQADGKKLMKIFLDDKDKDTVEEKFKTFAAVYKKLTTKDAEFMFPEVV
jgi:small subunit ribosomal protein S7e